MNRPPSRSTLEPELRPQLEALTAAYAAAEPFAAPELERLLRAQAEVSGGKAGPLIHATRVAVTGRANSPGLFDVLELIGKERVVDRLRAGVASSRPISNSSINTDGICYTRVFVLPERASSVAIRSRCRLPSRSPRLSTTHFSKRTAISSRSVVGA